MTGRSVPGWHRVRRGIVFAAVVLLAACGEEASGPPGGMKIPVSVVTVQPASTEIFVELPGRVEAIKDAQIRARVTGIVTAINFQQGSDVKKGQLLFTIAPAPYEAVRAQAAAQLKRSEADAQAARLLAERYSRLIKANAVSRQEYDNAQAASAQAQAAIAAAKAALQTANIDLGYTKVTSPIDGRIGKSLVTEGALVSASNATQMATVQQLDRVYVDLTRSTSELARLREALASGQLVQSDKGNAQAQVLLESGRVYDHAGELLFSGVTVDPTTGQVNLRAVFPNPDQILLPGMYVRVRLQQGTDEKALLVPQQAIQRAADGRSTLMLVKEGKVQPSPVSVGPVVEGKSIIYEGLAAGDTVIVEGFQKIRPGADVQPVPWKAPSGQGAQGAGQGGVPTPSGPNSQQDNAAGMSGSAAAASAPAEADEQASKPASNR